MTSCLTLTVLILIMFTWETLNASLNFFVFTNKKKKKDPLC